MTHLPRFAKDDLRIIVQTKIIPLISGFCEITLHSYVIVTVPNPILRLKLLRYYYKLEKSDEDSYRAFDFVYRFCNSIVNDRLVQEVDVTNLIGSLVKISSVTNDNRWSEIIDSIVAAMKEYHLEVPMYEVRPLTPASTQPLNQNSSQSDTLSLFDVKRLYQNRIKKKRVQILDGVHEGKIGTFMSWSRNKSKIKLDDKPVIVGLSRNVKLLEFPVE